MSRVAAEPTSGRDVYLRLLRYAKPYWRTFSLSLVGMIAYAATEPLFAALMKPLLDGSFVERNLDTIRTMPFILVGLFGVRCIEDLIDSYYMRWVGRRVVADLRQEMFDHLLRAPARYYDSNSSGHILAKLTYNVENVANAATNAMTTLVRDGFTVLGLLAYMLYVDAVLATIFLVVGPTMAISIRYAMRRFRKISRRIQDRVGELTHVVQEAIEAHRVVKAFGGEDYESRHFSQLNEKTRSLQMRMVATESVSVPLVQLITAIAIAFIVYLASMEGMRSEISIGTFMSFVVAMGLLLPPVKRLSSVNAQLQKGIIAAQSLFELLDTDSEKDSGTRQVSAVRGRVEFRSVCHEYAEEKGKVLHDINLTVEPGETVALVGRSGSGKSTLVSLLPRFYDPTEGQILIDGLDVKELTLRNLRAQISLVSQDVVLFNDTVALNIAYGQLEPPAPEDLRRAAAGAHAVEFIEALPQGFDTLIGDRGVLLSGGQRQRLAIARAMLKNAPILILDEATSSLDTEAERHIQAALEGLMRERTTLVIAHRLSTIEQADRIVVLHEGRVVEQGRHLDLLEQDGYYARLHRLQFQGIEGVAAVAVG